ncbi:unnamed protein product [Trichogramma brassicae]|uniref:Uncharacterized protein n=1 Tax=Trichogramma brassicae TaxID=86971 RepID=A0A6H5J4N5_9HYME|nr:unnamed protein product [Trichogramma brassicae]
MYEYNFKNCTDSFALYMLYDAAFKSSDHTFLKSLMNRYVNEILCDGKFNCTPLISLPRYIEDRITSLAEGCIEAKLCSFRPNQQQIGDNIQVEPVAWKNRTSQLRLKVPVIFNEINGRIFANLTGSSARVRLALDYQVKPCRLMVEDMAIHLPEHVLDFSQLGFSLLVKSVEAFGGKPLILSTLVDQVRNAVANIVLDVDCEKFRRDIFLGYPCFLLASSWSMMPPLVVNTTKLKLNTHRYHHTFITGNWNTPNLSVSTCEMRANWEGPLPNLLDIFRPEEIEDLLVDFLEWPDMYDDNDIVKYDFIEFVVRTGYKDEPKVGEDGKPLLHRTTALHHAARRGRFHAPMVPLLFNIFNRFDVNYIDDRGASHFMFACMHNCVEAVEKFLELGQDPNFHEKTGESPMSYALYSRSKDMLRILLRNGADPNLTGNDAAMTPLHRLSLRLLDNELLDDSIMNVHIDLVEMIFEDCQDKYKPVNVEARNKFGDTALHFALKENMRKVVEVLLRRGADPNVADSYGSTALHIICKKKRRRCLGKDAVPSMRRSQSDSAGRRPGQ